MTQTDMAQFEMRLRPDCVKLLDLLCRVLNAGVIGDSERLSIACGLTDKFVNHTLTVLYLTDGTKRNLPSVLFSLVDCQSIYVLTRASLESFLTFHYVFYTPNTKEEQDYKYWCYKAAGIAERQDATEEYRKKQAEEKEELKRLRDKLESNAVFQSLTQGQQGQILRGKWKLPSWREIAIDVGFNEKLVPNMYKHLSGSAHSSCLSVAQSVEIQKNGKQQEAISASIVIMNPVIANMIREYCGLFPQAQDVLNKDPEGSHIMDWWIQIAAFQMNP